MGKLISDSLMALLSVDYMPAFALVWVVLAGMSAVLIRRRGGKPGLPLPHPPAIHGGDGRGATEQAHDVEATERSLHSLEERLDFVESLLRGRQGAERDALRTPAGSRTSAGAPSSARSGSREEA